MTDIHAQGSTLLDTVLATLKGFWLTQIQNFHPLRPLRRWLDGLTINSPQMAHWVARLVPAQCPFERDICLFGRAIAHIPPLCKLNPFYNELVSLRFRALCYLVDQCGEDIQSYC